MMYEEVVRDFDRRTQKNLEAIDRLREEGNDDVFEVTQLVNSTLGLLVFPKEKYIDQIPDMSLSQLHDEGWTIPKMRPGFQQVSDLNQLVRYLRNAIAHFNIEFLGDPEEAIDVLEVWNKRNGKTNWKATLSVEDLRGFTSRFAELLLTS